MNSNYADGRAGVLINDFSLVDQPMQYSPSLADRMGNDAYHSAADRPSSVQI